MFSYAIARTASPLRFRNAIVLPAALPDQAHFARTGHNHFMT
jgi:hypothetical protein